MAGKPRQPSSHEPRSKKKPLKNQQDGLIMVNSGQASARQTPYQRMRERLDARSAHDATQAITTVDDLHAHIRADPTSDQVVICMKLLWVSIHQHKQLKFIRLHFMDADASEPLDKLLDTFRDQYADNAADVDALLFTATAWGVDLDDNSIPADGAIVQISRCSNLGLFWDAQAQATIRLTNLTSA